MVMYDFNDGAVVLDYTNGRFTIYKNGELHETGWDDEQQQNPIVAVQEFTNCVGDILRKRAKAYLRSRHHNTIMGCTVADGKCMECTANVEGSHCLFGKTHFAVNCKEGQENE